VSTLALELDSNLDSVDSAEAAVLREAEALGLDEDDLHRVGIAVRECMVNAVVHGNRYNSRKHVKLNVERTADTLTIVIADEGAGFDPDEVPDPLEGDNLLRQSGRGVMMIRAFMDEMAIRKLAPCGTEVKMVKYKAGKVKD
jgi:serine/threonine-protein kinase RsbW